MPSLKNLLVNPDAQVTFGPDGAGHPENTTAHVTNAQIAQIKVDGLLCHSL